MADAATSDVLHAGGFLLSEANGELSRESGTLLSGQNLVAGAIVGKITVAGASASAVSGTGNGAFALDGTTPVLAGAIAGDYKVECIAAATNGGEFAVKDPNNTVIGFYKVGAAAFATQIKFTIADGGTDFVTGDVFTVTVAAGSGKFKAVNSSAVDGSAVAYGILFEAVNASAADKPCVIIRRQAEVDGDLLTLGTSGYSSTVATQLESLGIKQR
ncbi:MAG: head decoration protein [Rhodospirillaceae bacterium]